MNPEFDIFIKNAKIIDGTGKTSFKGSLGITGEKIVAMGDIKGDAKQVIDASGLTAMPGFIDAHTHADWTILWYPQCESFVMQGVTSFVAGQCGSSPAPLSDIIRPPSLLSDHLEELDPHKYFPKPLYPLDQVNNWMEDKFGWAIDWKTMEDFFDRVEKTGISANYVPLVGHGNMRFMIMGMDYKRHASKTEVDDMIELIQQAMEEGCYGMSTGMDYDPDVFASQDEIIKCVSVLKDYGGVYSPHWRRTGRRRGVKPGTPLVERVDGIKDCIEVCRASGVPTEIAHLADAFGIRAAGVAPLSLQRATGEATLEVVDEAIKEGLPLYFDFIPIPHNDLRSLPYLVSLLTPWIREMGSPERLAEFLMMEDYRKDVKDELFAGKWHIRRRFSPISNPKYWAKNIIIRKSQNLDYVNRSLADIAADREKDPLDVMFDIIIEDPYTRASTYYRSREVDKVFIKHPACSICLDSSAYDDKYHRKTPPYTMPKEGTYDGFVSVLVRHTLENKLLTLEEAAMRVSSNAARAYNIKERGLLKTGYFADVVLLDMANLQILGDDLEPRRFPKGVEYVIVNGSTVVKNGKHTKARPGKVLKKR